MKRRTSLAALVVGVFALVVWFVAVVWFVDPFLIVIIGLVPLVWFGLPSAIVAIILILFSLRTGRSKRVPLTILLTVLGVGCFVASAIPANRFVHERAVAAAKEYPARVAPLLEAYRVAHGVYPGKLDQLPSKPRVPRLLRGSNRYQSDGVNYSFWFPQPGGLIDTWNYDSETHEWHLST